LLFLFAGPGLLTLFECFHMLLLDTG